LNAYYNSSSKQIIVKNTSVTSVMLYNIAGQAVSAKLTDGVVSASHLKNGIYILSAKDSKGIQLGSQKVVIF